jgi:hypothetical protein
MYRTVKEKPWAKFGKAVEEDGFKYTSFDNVTSIKWYDNSKNLEQEAKSKMSAMLRKFEEKKKGPDIKIVEEKTAIGLYKPPNTHTSATIFNTNVIIKLSNLPQNISKKEIKHLLNLSNDSKIKIPLFNGAAYGTAIVHLTVQEAEVIEKNKLIMDNSIIGVSRVKTLFQ